MSNAFIPYGAYWSTPFAKWQGPLANLNSVRLAAEVGRRFLHSILAECHAFEVRAGIGPNGFPQPEMTGMHFGEQQVGQRLYQTWHLKAPGPIMEMLRECEPKYQKVQL